MGRGIATALLMRCLDAARQQRMTAVALEVGIESRAAIGLYTKLGFVPTGRKGDTLLMEATISESLSP
jgi:ribosomal protein S18 acetylase RimI-like enzyme